MATDRRTAAIEAGEVWHTLDVAAVARVLGVELEVGLPSEEANKRLSLYGGNVIEEKPRRSVLAMLVGQFADFMILVLIAAAVISGFIGDVKDAVVIVAIVVVNAVIGFAQAFRAERALSALKKLAPARAVVIRERRHLALAASGIVPGDVVVVEAGDQVPADLRLTDARQLRIGEAALTGESVPVDKNTEPVAETDLPLGDRRNMAFKGTTVTYGRGRGVAVATGMRTELGKLAGLLETGIVETQTPLQQRLTRFGKSLAFAILGICAIIFVTGLARGEPAVLMFLTAISLAVAAIPEALPATVTISLALGAGKMAERNALVRWLAAVETLGSVTFICSDKTGTLTRNEMEVDEIVTAEGTRQSPNLKSPGEPWASLFTAAALNNDAHVADDGGFFGDPTEVALIKAAVAHGLDPSDVAGRLPRIGEVVFDSERKRMTTIHPADNGFVAYTKGAPEGIVDRCVEVLTADGRETIDEQQWLAEAERMANQGLRVLGLAERYWPEFPGTAAAAVERDLVLLGLVGLIDPPRPEAVEAVRSCRSAGITPVMITGDHAATARAVALRLGILDDEGAVMTGAELAAVSDEELAERVAGIRVYARVDPAQKIRVVESLQARGEFVAMTGDGVNDAPALKRADIGVAMGKAGTDVAREVAGLVLLDDNFATIVAAVREGRRIYDNLRKVIKYIMTGNSAEILAIFLAPFLGLPIPLLPIQILWVNLVTDGLPALAMTAELEERHIMQRPPRPPSESVFAGGLWQHMIWVGMLMAGVALAAQGVAIGSGSANWQTMVFSVLTFAQALHVLAIRSDRASLFQQGLFSNMPMLGAVGLVFALQLVIIYVPVLNPIFNTTPLTAGELAFSIAMALIVFAAVEAEKWLVRSGRIHRA